MNGVIAALRRPKAGPAALLMLHVAGLAIFIHGFLLTRVHLAERAGPPPAAAANRTAPPFDRVVWVMIDALRYDFVVRDGRYSCAPGALCHQGHMPYLANLSRLEAARTFMFVSEAPTTTTQRLKALATGGLPSFFDVSNSFTAGALRDDNLIDQLAAAGRKMAFLGDTTWAQLFPTAWAWSRPYPCFNVKDLHTVDDGVWEHLPAALAAPDTWDGLLVVHYLGVDHCGHSHGVGSQQMADKLGQMDDHVRQVVAALAAGAGPGGPYERTLLLVSGDHGQTLGGDHGGGSPEEVDSVLVAVDVGSVADVASRTEGGGSDGASQEAGNGSRQPGSGLAAPAACRANCSCGLDGNQCAPDLQQIDLTPTLAAMLGVPNPFGNLGKLSAELWQLAAAHLGSGGGGGAGTHGTGSESGTESGRAWERSLAEVLQANVQQVHKYLHTYAATPGASFSRAALARLDRLVAAATEPAATVAERVPRCYAYLEAAADVAQKQWTQFGDLPMLAGLALFAASLAVHAVAAFSSSGGSTATPSNGSSSTSSAAASAPTNGGWVSALGRNLAAWQLVARWRPGHWVWLPTFQGWLAAMALLHGLGIFSFFYLLSEGKMVCYLVASSCLALALATGRASRAAGKGMRGVVGLAVMSLRCNAMMAILGVAHHTGQGFWARLTVHEPQPAGDVERGWHGKLGRMKAFAGALLARAGVDRLPAAVLAVAQHTLLCTLPIAILLLLTERLLRHTGGSCGILRRLLRLAAFVSVAAYLQLEDASKQGLLPQGISLQELRLDRIWACLPIDAASWAVHALATASQLLRAAWPAAGRYGALLAVLPLRQLLPHGTYALCGASVLLWLAAGARRQLRGAAAASALAQLVLAALLQVSDRNTPLILLLGLLELVAVSRLLAKRAELLAAGSSTGGASAAGAGVRVAGEAGALVALVAAQLFYATGHLCEFAGLQHTAGFIGSEEFHLWRSGSLLVLNTFGGMLLVLLALPAVAQHVADAAAGSSAADARDAASQPAAGSAQPQTQPLAKARKVAGADNCGASSPGTAALQQAVLVAGLVRTMGSFCATLSASVQRRHLYAWALFAPKFAFEACFLLLADLALLLASVLA